MLELAGLEVSAVGLESQCNWMRLKNLVPSQLVQRGHLFITSHVQSAGLSILCTLLPSIITSTLLGVVIFSVLLGHREFGQLAGRHKVKIQPPRALVL